VPTGHIPPEPIAEARRLCLHTNVPNADICALLGVGARTFHKRLKLWGWPMRSKRIPRKQPAQARASGANGSQPHGDSGLPPPAPPTDAEREALAARLFRLIEAEVAASERAARALGNAPDPAGEKADRARALGALGRALQATNSINKASKRSSDDEPEPAFRSAEELARAISQHLDDMEREAASELPRQAEAGRK
jgi:hypothetical protein